MSPDLVFHLAWHREYLSTEALVLLLIPADCEPFVGATRFEAINGNGRPLEPISAHMADLASIRSEDDTTGSPSAVEAGMLFALSRRARMASYVLPRIIPTSKYPSWAKLRMDEDLRGALIRAVRGE